MLPSVMFIRPTNPGANATNERKSSDFLIRTNQTAVNRREMGAAIRV